MPMLGTIKVEDRKRYEIFSPFKPPFREEDVIRDESCRVKTLGARIHHLAFIRMKERTPIEPYEREKPTTPIEDCNLEPLILWEGLTTTNEPHRIQVDPMLATRLRQHQRDGVQFLFDCLTGLKMVELPPKFGANQPVTGCLLADDMGLGKTLSSIVLLWTLLNQGFNKRPMVRKAIVVCPATLVKNWAAELEKWLQGRCKSTPVVESSGGAVVALYEGFKWNPISKVLITSYECLRLHVQSLAKTPIDLVICDEAHRLKNDKTKTAAAIGLLPTTRRLLLSGTPIQNDLDEFYSLTSLCVPAIFNDTAKFRKYFANPILLGREPDATDKEQTLATTRLEEMHKICNSFIMRRTNEVLAKVLPPKVIFLVFCNLTQQQQTLYEDILASVLSRGDEPKGKRVLSFIQKLMKLCNHPMLLNEATPSTICHNQRIDYSLSGKLMFLTALLNEMKSSNAKDRIVIVSNFTQTLDLIQTIIAQYIRLPFLRLDGKVSSKQRHKLVTQFNDPSSQVFAFLLSSKAGGCGINLIGANRLVMFDPDWNPANDKQALARIWRDGQKKECYVYRLFSTSTIEEKIFQRQQSKDSLSSIVVSDGDCVGFGDWCNLDYEARKQLFQLNKETLSETHDMLSCSRAECQRRPSFVSTESPTSTERAIKESDLLSWTHHRRGRNIDEPLTSQAVKMCSQTVSFVMSVRIEVTEGDRQAAA